MSLTFSDLSDMLHTSYRYSTRVYGHISCLADMLQFKFEIAMQDIGNTDHEPRELLYSYLRSERAVMNAWNKHRLGTAPTRLRHPKEASARGEIPYDPSDNLVEQLDTFPLRREAVLRGWPLPATGLAPIYQEYADPPGMYATLPTPSSAALTIAPLKARGRRDGSRTNYDKLSDAPPSTLPFPAANLTLVELLTFLPQSLKAWPVIDRLIGAGATTSLLTRIINQHRHMPHGEISNNSVYRMMRGSMDKRSKVDARYANWSVKKHASIAPPLGFNPHTISVAGFKAPGKDDGASARVRLRDLADGVRIMPQGYDALDLTRCVAYALRYPGEDWAYPDDMAFVLGLLESAGPKAVQEGHLDQSAVARLRGVETRGSRRTVGEKTVELVLRGKRKCAGSDANAGVCLSNGDTRPSNVKPLPSRPQLLGTVAFMSNHDSGSDSDSDVYRGPKRMKKTNAPPRTSGRTKRVIGAYSEVTTLGTTMEEGMAMLGLNEEVSLTGRE